jgi:hypothetical protein
LFAVVPAGPPAAKSSPLRAGAGAYDSGGAIPHFVRLDFAHATRLVLLSMAGIMAAAAIVALLGLRAGLQAEDSESAAALAD